VRSLVTNDTRFGWGMFSSQVQYVVSYDWVLADGNVVTYIPGTELKGRTRGRLLPGSHTTNYAYGAAASWVKGYARYMYRHNAPLEAIAFQAIMLHRTNKEGGYKETIIRYPSE